MPRPDFFIVGAPKCGTTALFTYLSGHPDIGMARTKEPNFFAPDTVGRRRCATVEQYLSYFQDAAGKSRIGEASVKYLASRLAPQAILDFSPSAQIIIMLRNPVDVLHASHSQRLYAGSEHILRFEEAVDSQVVRYWRQGPYRGEPVGFVSYRELTKFSEQVQRYFALFGRERVHVIWFDDFVSAPEVSYENVLAFLGLGSDGRQNFKVVNDNKRVRFYPVHRLMRHPVLVGLKRSFPIFGEKVRAAIDLLNVAREARPPIEGGFRQLLEAEYAPEMRRLEKLLGKTLDRQAAGANNFSPDDRVVNWTNSSPGDVNPGYLGTPSGAVKRFTPDPNASSSDGRVDVWNRQEQKWEPEQ